MEFTSNIVLSLLMPYRGRPYIRADVKKVYRWVSLLPDSISEMRPDMLYVCRLSDAMMRNLNGPDCHYVCLCDRYLSDDDRENNEAMKNLILVEENRSISWLLNLIQNRFIELDEWEKKLKDVLLRDGSYQDIMDASEHYLKNALFVMDGAYRLIAYSKVYKSPDPVNISLYEKGYHTPESMQLFYKHNRFDEYFRNPGVVFCPAGRVSRFESLTQWCWHDGTPLIHVIEVFCNSPISAESTELFEVMMSYILICFKREQQKVQSPGLAFGRFLRDLIYNKLTDINQIAECAKRAGIPMVGNFNAYRIIFHNNSNVLPGRFVKELHELLPGAKIVAKDYEISVLNVYPTPEVDELSQRCIDRLQPLLEKHMAMIGVSAPFTNLTALSHACDQAGIAISYGQKDFRHSKVQSKPSNNVYYYADALIFHMLDQSSREPFNFFRSNPFLQKINELIAYDRDNNTCLSDILFWYLYYERRATEAGKVLHMHRNTISYHVQRISEITGLDLEDYLNRQQLMLAYHYLELQQNS